MYTARNRWRPCQPLGVVDHFDHFSGAADSALSVSIGEQGSSNRPPPSRHPRGSPGPVMYPAPSVTRAWSFVIRQRRTRPPSPACGDQRVQHGDPSIAHLRHVDAADRRRLLRHSQVEGQMAQIAADVDPPRGGEHKIGHAVEQLLSTLVQGLIAVGRPLGGVPVDLCQFPGAADPALRSSHGQRDHHRRRAQRPLLDRGRGLERDRIGVRVLRPRQREDAGAP